MTAHGRPGPPPLAIDEKDRVISNGEYVGRLVELGRRRWVHARPGKAPSAKTYRDRESAARALVDVVAAESVPG
ncbi:hypothetical protein [Aeromicrobium endophyticum]|nr:hypothetical protein [Aeromicrobium endophyticum]